MDTYSDCPDAPVSSSHGTAALDLSSVANSSLIVHYASSLGGQAFSNECEGRRNSRAGCCLLREVLLQSSPSPVP